MGAYLAVVAAYVVALVMFALSSAAAELFAIVFAYYVAASVACAAWWYRYASVDGGDHLALLFTFLFIGGVALPAYYFAHARKIEAPPQARVAPLGVIGRVLASMLLAVSTVRMALVFRSSFAHLPLPPLAATMGEVSRWIFYLAFVVTVIVIVRRDWSPLRKAAWLAASLLGNVLVIPVVHFGYAAPASTSDQMRTR